MVSLTVRVARRLLFLAQASRNTPIYAQRGIKRAAGALAFEFFRSLELRSLIHDAYLVKGTGVNYANIKYRDIADGEGVRTTLFVSGCSHHCKNCFQPETWSFSYGQEFTPEVAREVLATLDDFFVDGLTFLGGEPMEPENQRGLLELARAAKTAHPEKTIWCYTGDVYEELVDPDSPRRTEATDELLSFIDVLIDGPYIEEQHDITLRFCGSANQRVIDLNKTRESGEVVLWKDDPIYSTHSM